MKKPIRVLQYGIGPIGLESARAVLDKQSSGLIELVGVVDVDPEKVGRDIGKLIGKDDVGITVSASSAESLARWKPDVVLHCTSSFLPDVEDQLLECIRAGAHVVSSTEELSFPDERDKDLATRLDRACVDQGVVLLGTGVNPGYAMDALVVMATGPCISVKRIDAERRVNAGLRRGPLQRKVGAGITPAEFDARRKTGKFGHIGMTQSLRLVATALGFSPDRITDTLEPVIAEAAVSTDFVQVEKGQVAGIHQEAIAWRVGEPIIRLDLKMAVGIPVSSDRVHVDGTPPMNLHVEGGIFGDSATVAALVNSIPLVMEARPGLRTVTDLPVSRAFAAL